MVFRLIVCGILVATAALFLPLKSDPVVAESSPQQLWVARYNGTAGSRDEANAMKVDGDGNVYVTGESDGTGGNSDFATVKYDTNGNQLWVARFESGGYDIPSALVLDGRGFVYVTGTTGTAHPGDYGYYTTVKYDATTGAQVWARTYGRGDDSLAKGVDVDSYQNVYVYGQSSGIPGLDGAIPSAVVTLKYDAGGTLQWAKCLQDHMAAAAGSLRVDIQGNINVTGTLWRTMPEPISPEPYAITARYSPGGTQLWAASYGNDSIEAMPRALTVDAAGVVYVVMDSQVGTSYSWATVKYDAAGNQVWVANNSGTGSFSQGVEAIAIDAQGNAIVTGSLFGEIQIVKYGPSGSQIWDSWYAGPYSHAGASDLIIDALGNSYVAGWVEATSSRDYATIKWDKDGNRQWVAQYAGSWPTGWDIPKAIALDNGGNVYVSGWSNTTGAMYGTGLDYATVKYRGGETRVRVVPSSNQVSVTTGGSPHIATVTLTFPSSAYRVDDWGTPTASGNTFIATAAISAWTGSSAMVRTTGSHTYDFGALAPGIYQFEFRVGGVLLGVGSFAVAAGKPATKPALPPAIRTPARPPIIVAPVAPPRGRR